MPDLLATARATRNRGTLHLFLGHPLSDGCDKTTVEPGNGYSPGVWTCGVSLWFEIAGALHTPDLMDEEAIAWGLADHDGCPPLIEAQYRAGAALEVTHRLAHLGGEGAEGVDVNQVLLSASMGAVDGMVAVVVKDNGPAGGRIAKLEWLAAERTLLIDGLRLVCEEAPAECRILPAGDGHDSPVAALCFPLSLAAGATRTLAFRTEHGFAGRAFANSIPLTRRHAGISAADGIARSIAAWKQDLPARVFAPDRRVARTWERCAGHILAAMECGQPRIGAVNYPVLWLRDCVIVLRALDLIGRPDLARLGNDALAPTIFGGGFGAESDAPGEGIWALVEHARMTGDRDWLRQVFPFIRLRVGWIERMLAADRPLRALSENRIPDYQHTPGVNILCLPARNGLINGRMDWHSPDFFINCWSSAGLRLAGEAAALVGEPALAASWTARAAALDQAIIAHLLPHYGNDRDPIIAPWPSGALPEARPALGAAFARWYRRGRLTGEGQRRPEALWTYFEAGQIHNALLLGMRDEAWVNLDGMLGDGRWPVCAYPEGKAGGSEALPFRNGGGARGWLDNRRAKAGNMPHNWTTAEMVALIRDLFVVEEGAGLVLGLGVPKAWMVPGSRFGVSDLPTSRGAVSYTVTIGADGAPAVDYRGPQPWRLALPG